MKRKIMRDTKSRYVGKRNLWWPLLTPTLFFAIVIYYEELFIKFYCFGSVSPSGAIFTLMFSMPLAIVLGLLCASSKRHGKAVLVCATAVISLWNGAQAIYYHLFKTFLTIFSLTKMGMVAGDFGEMAVGEVLVNWFPVLMMAAPVALAWKLRNGLLSGEKLRSGMQLKWAILAGAVQLVSMAVVLMCNWGTMSPRYIYTQAAVPSLEVQNFGMFTQTQLEIRRVIFGIKPDEVDANIEIKPDPEPQPAPPGTPEEPDAVPQPTGPQVMEIDFDALIARDSEDEDLVGMHQYFSQLAPTQKNAWTGKFEGKNLIWVVAEGFCTLAMDPERTPTLWKLTHEGIVCENFYVPLWGVSTSDGEYAATTGLVPKSGVWSYSLSAENYMPFGFGNQFRNSGYRTLAYHDYLYDYYDRNLSHPNMGFDYYALGHGLSMEEVWPLSDLEMMEIIVPRFVDEDSFMVYCLTVSGHLNYNFTENTMAQRHQETVADLNYSEPVLAYLACQMELELAMESLVNQLEAAGKLEDTVIVLSGDHYPYGLKDEEYSELLGHEVDPVFEIYENSLILWSADITEPVYVEKYCSSLDIMPTLSNLFGLEYDSRLVAGRDILSDTPGLVIFSDYSFLTYKGAYNSVEDTFTCWDGSILESTQVDELIAEVQNRVAYSAAILDKDYYEVVFQGEDAPMPER